MHVLPGLQGLAADLGEIAIALHLFDRHDRIAAARQHGARHDLDARVGIGQRLRRVARGLGARYAQAAGVAGRRRGR